MLPVTMLPVTMLPSLCMLSKGGPSVQSASVLSFKELDNISPDCFVLRRCSKANPNHGFTVPSCYCSWLYLFTIKTLHVSDIGRNMPYVAHTGPLSIASIRMMRTKPLPAEGKKVLGMD